MIPPHHGQVHHDRLATSCRNTRHPSSAHLFPSTSLVTCNTLSRPSPHCYTHHGFSRACCLCELPRVLIVRHGHPANSHIEHALCYHRNVANNGECDENFMERARANACSQRRKADAHCACVCISTGKETRLVCLKQYADSKTVTIHSTPQRARSL
jgi:hypothetical protein